MMASVMLLAVALTAPRPLPAATLTVTDLGDTGAPGQLRTLINAAAPGDTIIIPAGIITLTGAAGDDLNASGDLDIHKDLIIQGAGAGATIVDGGRVDRVFDIFDPASVSISKVTIRNGNPGSLVFNGGGIRDSGRLTLTEVILTGNDASDGGGIFAQGAVTLTNVILRGNTAGAGGGIFVFGSGGILTLTNVTLSGNTAALSGGGISTIGPMTLINVTISGNAARGGSGLLGSGGGIAGGPMTLINVTISGNMADIGGGISATGAQFKNTIVANSLSGGNCSVSGIASLGHNLDSGSTCGFTGPGDLSNTDQKLGPLQNNGGPTFTHALLPGSPAIDAGDNSGCPPTDQRGITRPQGKACDIGAFEFVSTVAIPSLNGWGMLGLGALLAGALAVRLRRRTL